MQEQSIALANISHDNQLARHTQQSAQTNVASIERVASLVAGSLLSMYGLRHRPFGLLLALVGGELIYRGVSGHCPVYQRLGVNTAESSPEQHITKAITINRPAADLYHHWQHSEDLPNLLKQVETVERDDANQLHWVASGPMGMRLTWDTLLPEHTQDSSVTWRSVSNAPIEHVSKVSFVAAPGNRGTEVRVSIRYRLPGGSAGALVAKSISAAIGTMLADDLRRFKQVVETGQLSKNQGQLADQQATQQPPRDRDEVLKGSQDSFPASDPPAWMAGNQEKEA